jgi:hypothetical protein
MRFARARIALFLVGLTGIGALAWRSLGRGSVQGPEATSGDVPIRCYRLLLGTLALSFAVLGTFGAGLWRKSQDQAIARALTGGDPDLATPLLRRYGCAGCHTIPSVPGAEGLVSAPLAELRERVFIAGRVRNTPENLIRFIVSPQEVSSHSAMPATGISPEEARHVAAFLYAN